MATLDPFAVLGLPRRFDLDPAAIEQAFLERSAALHPDMLGAEAMGQLGDDGEEVERASSALNQARQILTDPEQRAVALWRLWGGHDDKVLPGGFLTEMMAIREQIEEERQAATPGAAARWEQWGEQKRAEYAAKIGPLFDQLTLDSSANAPVLRQIRLELNAWRYVERMIEQLDS